MEREFIGDYRILREIGHGRAGTVYLATPTQPLAFAQPGEPLAIKVYKTAILGEARQFERIRREFEVGVTVAHPNLVRMLAYSPGAHGDEPFLVMAYVDGIPLSTWLGLFHPLPGPIIRRLFEQVVLAVAALHDAGNIHRDLKPANVMVTSTLEAVVMDLGVVRVKPGDSEKIDDITPSDQFLGTIRNAAPEALVGDDDDARSDLYSLGTILYALLHGEEVFSDETQFIKVSQRVLRDSPAFDSGICNRDQIRAALMPIAQLLLQKDPTDRPPTAAELLGVLKSQVPVSLPSSVPLHAYVATALTGLERDSAVAMAFLSAKIADVAKEYDIFVYEPRRATDPLLHPDVEPSVVYMTDRARVAQADLLFVVVNQPSFGVGQEIEIASSFGKPIVLLQYSQGVHVSRMVTGSFANLVGKVVYETPEELERQLRKLLSAEIDGIRNWVQSVRQPTRFDLGQQIVSRRTALGYESAAELAGALHLAPHLIEGLEHGQLENIGVGLLAYIARGLNTEVKELVGGNQSVSSLPPTHEASIRRLESVARRANFSAQEFLDLRDEFMREAAASGRALEVSESDWVDRHRAYDQRRIREAGVDDSPSGHLF